MAGNHDSATDLEQDGSACAATHRVDVARLKSCATQTSVLRTLSPACYSVTVMVTLAVEMSMASLAKARSV